MVLFLGACVGIADCKKDRKDDAAGGAWGKGRRESHFHVTPRFPLGPGCNGAQYTVWR